MEHQKTRVALRFATQAVSPGGSWTGEGSPSPGGGGELAFLTKNLHPRYRLAQIRRRLRYHGERHKLQHLRFYERTDLLHQRPFYCPGGVVLGSNAVIKFPKQTGSADPHIEASSISCENSPVNPTIFTASDDNNYGCAVTTNQDPNYTGSVSGNYGGTAYLYSGFNNQHQPAQPQ